ncbi:uncharacterized protein LOC110038186 [Phalaenopsis equestris]|uniref:uncharacterized protein LOC110038186 n=1 Tax=Phalaenopsis equestris TaxID=78828 RepID=UPI0009E45988|nr:uncharacterized protein LOC110038186 [Phalaenopsis equestris]
MKMEMRMEIWSSPSTWPSQLRFLIILLILLLSPSASQAGEYKSNEKEEKLTLDAVERGIGFTRFNSHWEAFSSWAKLTWMTLRPPESSGKSGTGEKMKAASKKSFKTSKDTVEMSAAAAAKAAEKAVGMTKDKIKKAVFKSKGGGGQDAEL